MRIHKKVIVSGPMVEIYEYEDGISVGWTSNKEVESEVENEEDSDEVKEGSEENRLRSLRRARLQLIRVVNSNFGFYGRDFTAKFLTLTFREHVTDLNTANKLFGLFIKRLNYRLFGSKCANIRYTVVPEFTKRGRVHYHVILYNIPYVKADVLQQIWQHGYIKINKINNIDNIGAYIAKYMSKSFDDRRMKGQKCYFNSKGLRRPLEITDKKSAETVEKSLPESCKVYEAEYYNEYTGKVRYRQYNLNRQKK